MVQPLKKQYLFGANGFAYTQQTVYPDDTLTGNSNGLFIAETGEIRNYNGSINTGFPGATRMFNIDTDGYATLGANSSAAGSGYILQYFGKTIWFVGTGAVGVYNPAVAGAPLSLGTASSIPRIATLNDAGNGYDAALQVGLAPQSGAPILSVPAVRGGTFSGLLTGSYSLRIARKRKSGAISNASPASNAITFDHQSGIAEIPVAPVGDGTNEWLLYFTPTGRGTTGDWFLLPVTIPESKLNDPTYSATFGSCHIQVLGSRRLEIEFNDTDLLPDTPEITNYAPTACSFLAGLGNHLCYVGTFGGNGFSVSKASQPEAVPPNYTQFASERIIGVASNSMNNNFLYVLCRGSIYGAIFSSGSDEETPPVILTELYGKTGVFNDASATVVGQDMFFITATKRFARINPNGELDLTLGDDVSGLLKDLSPNASVGYEENLNTVFILDRNMVLGYSLTKQKWNTPIYLSNGISTVEKTLNYIYHAITIKGDLIMSVINNDGTYTAWSFNHGTGGSNWIAETPVHIYGSSFELAEVERMTLVYSSGSSGTIAVRFYRNKASSPSWTANVAVTGDLSPFNVTRELEVKVLDFETLMIRIDGSGFKQIIETLLTEGKIHSLRKNQRG